MKKPSNGLQGGCKDEIRIFQGLSQYASYAIMEKAKVREVAWCRLFANIRTIVFLILSNYDGFFCCTCLRIGSSGWLFRAVLSGMPGDIVKVQPEHSGFFYLYSDSEIDQHKLSRIPRQDLRESLRCRSLSDRDNSRTGILDNSEWWVILFLVALKKKRRNIQPWKEKKKQAYINAWTAAGQCRQKCRAESQTIVPTASQASTGKNEKELNAEGSSSR